MINFIVAILEAAIVNQYVAGLLLWTIGAMLYNVYFAFAIVVNRASYSATAAKYM
jgi:hypothetical protein